MPKTPTGSKPSTDTVERMLKLLPLIPRFPRKVSPGRLRDQLAEQGYDVAIRTIQRDLVRLSAELPLVCNERSKPYGWSWQEDASVLDIPGMDPVLALAFHIAEGHLAVALPAMAMQALRPHFARASEVLSGVPGQKYKKWSDKVHVGPYAYMREAPVVAPGVIEVVHEALLQDRQFRAVYASLSEGTVEEREVNPIMLVYRGSIGYLAATWPGQKDRKQMVLHRIREAELLPARRSVPPDFDRDAFVEGGAYQGDGGPKRIKLKVRFTGWMASSAPELKMAPDQRETREADGSTVIEAEVLQTRELERWLLSIETDVEVLAPASLRKDFAKRIKAMARVYR